MKSTMTKGLILSLLIGAAACTNDKPAPGGEAPGTAQPVPAQPEAAKAPEAKPAEPASDKKAVPPAAEPEKAAGAPTGTAGNEGAAGSKKVELQFYIMSQCPFGVQVLDGVIPALRKIGDHVDFKLDFIGGMEGDKFQSLHGDPEVAGNIVELCTMKHVPDKWMDMFTCWNANFQALPDNWKECASKSSLSEELKTKLAGCIDGAEGREMLKASFEKAGKAGAQGSPTVFINGEPWTEGRDEISFIKGICAKLGDPAPEICANLPKPVPVKLLVIADKRCSDRTCNTVPITNSLKMPVPGLEFTVLDWETPEAKKAFEEHGLEFLPAMIFDDSLAKDAEANSKLAQYLRPTKKEGYQLLMIEAYHDPRKEICDNKIDDTADGKVDCDDDHCKDKLVCRPEQKGDLKVFVMTHCPFGLRALDAMKDVLKAFGTEIKFDIHYIVTDMGGEFNALHGQIEVDESIRQLCVKKMVPENYKFMDYIWCRNETIRNQEPDTAWTKCAELVGLESAKVEECFNKEGKELLKAEAALALSLNISASPTWLVNNKSLFQGIDPAGIQQGICGANPTFEGCKQQLEGAPPAQQGEAPSCG